MRDFENIHEKNLDEGSLSHPNQHPLISFSTNFLKLVHVLTDSYILEFPFKTHTV